jgi:hypothetical protein
MFKTIKKIIKMPVFIISIFSIIVIFVCIYLYVNDKVIKRIKNNGYVSFSVLLYGTDDMLPGRLDIYIVLYNKKVNILKILSINTDSTIFDKDGKARSLNILFNENLRNNPDIAIKKIYLILRKIIGDTAETDFYINISFKTLNFITGKDKKLHSLLLKSNFENKDLESLNNFEIIKQVMHLMPCRILKNNKNCNFFDTNISRLFFIVSILRFKILKPTLMFCEMPVRYTKTRIEPDKQNIEEFLNKVYYIDTTSQINSKNILIDIKNASEKPHIAEKTAWLLRKNEFDVLDWNNFFITYDKTLIKDYKGNFKHALKIAKILKVGNVIVFYNSRIFSDIDVFIGKDYTYE